jgi:hypothetical protein
MPSGQFWTTVRLSTTFWYSRAASLPADLPARVETSMLWLQLEPSLVRKMGQALRGSESLLDIFSPGEQGQVDFHQ